MPCVGSDIRSTRSSPSKLNLLVEPSKMNEARVSWKRGGRALFLYLILCSRSWHWCSETWCKVAQVSQGRIIQSGLKIN